MGDRDESKNPRCPNCGAVYRQGECPSCGERTASEPAQLVALPPQVGSSGPPREVQLVREIKGPTVRDLMQASDAVLQQLPGQVRAMEQAVSAGDLAQADQHMDHALGTLHAGPGYRRRRLLSWPFLLWLWLLGLALGMLFWL